ncbi:hypothetical protein FQZ97_1000600 [compost metagenome]
MAIFGGSITYTLRPRLAKPRFTPNPTSTALALLARKANAVTMSSTLRSVCSACFPPLAGVTTFRMSASLTWVAPSPTSVRLLRPFRTPTAKVSRALAAATVASSTWSRLSCVSSSSCTLPADRSSAAPCRFWLSSSRFSLASANPW